MRFYIETYGCTANQGNSKEAEAALLEMGHKAAPMEQADLIIINTCAVTERTERKIKRRLLQIQGLSDRLVIAGCLAAALPGSLEDIKCLKKTGILDGRAAMEIADFLCERPPNSVRPLNAAGQFSTAEPFNTARSSPCQLGQYPYVLPVKAQDLCGIVNIAEGCRGGCSYCIVKKARGGLKSKTPDEIARSVEKLLKSGCIEIQLAAQDTAAYGLDIGTTLPELIERIVEIRGRFMLRIGMMNPDTAGPIQNGLSDVFCSPKVYRFLHMPVQSGSDKILGSMGRRYNAEDYRKIVDCIRRSVAGISLVTDVIAGYPGETAEDFMQTMDLIRSLQPDKVNVTKYSSRPGTPAARLYDMPDRIKKDRSRLLTRLWLELASERNRGYEGKILDALVTEQGRGNTMKARAVNYTGIVIEGKITLGSTVRVKATGSNAFYVTGSVLPQ